jgi:uncharacterized membrane protein YkgB
MPNTLWQRLDQGMIRFMQAHGVRLLRVALGLVFIWFGLLKVIGKSPVADLVARTVYWMPPDFFVPFLGTWEILVGCGLLFAVALRFTLFLFWLQMAGTFLVLLLRPEVAFQGGNPLLLTTEGEFVIKNLVLIAAGLVVGGTVRKLEPRR